MKRLVSIQDISCIGKCSQTIALPLISAMGVETSIIPTAVLSAHTMFPGFTFTDLSDSMVDIISHFKSLNLHFDAILTGYLGTVRHIEIISDFYEQFAKDDTLTVVDPVFADNGVMYTGFDVEYADAISVLCKKADYIVPNITEAAIMSGLSYRTDYDSSYVKEILDRLNELGMSNIIITSIRRNNENGIVARLSDQAEFEYFKPHIDATFHGTGDLFTSAFAGALLNDYSAYDAARLAVDYTAHTLSVTQKNKSHNWYGIDFEETIPWLIDRLYS